MNVLIKRISYFILPLLIVWLGFYIYFEKYIKLNAYEIFKEDIAFESSPNEFQYLVGGHSRLKRAIDIKEFPSCVIATSPGESYIETYYRLKYILNNTDKKFDTIILPFGFGTFKPNDFRRSIYWIKYVDFFEVGYHKNEIALYTSIWAEAKFLPFLPYYKKKIKTLFENKENRISIDKINGRFDKMKKSEQTQLIENDVDLLNEIGIVDKTTKHYIHQTILLAKEHNIRIAYIKSPLTKNYVEALGKLDGKKNISHHQLEEFVEDFPHVNVIDMEAVFLEQDSLFSDHHHLNLMGKKIFTPKLMTQLKEGI